jgi:hypothetical protein
MMTGVVTGCAADDRSLGSFRAWQKSERVRGGVITIQKYKRPPDWSSHVCAARILESQPASLVGVLPPRALPATVSALSRIFPNVVSMTATNRHRHHHHHHHHHHYYHRSSSGAGNLQSA